MLDFLTEFFAAVPELRSHDFFVTGESYAGHYVPAVASRVFLANRAGELLHPINLKGLAIGNGLTVPRVQVCGCGWMCSCGCGWMGGWPAVLQLCSVLLRCCPKFKECCKFRTLVCKSTPPMLATPCATELGSPHSTFGADLQYLGPFPATVRRLC